MKNQGHARAAAISARAQLARNTAITALSALATASAFAAAPSAAPADAPTVTETVLHSFTGGLNDGESPQTRLTEGGDGNLYGTTSAGGVSNGIGAECGVGCGTAFRITPAGVETIIHKFEETSSDGSSPQPDLLLAADGKLYGTSQNSAAPSYGIVFQLTLAGAESNFYSFPSLASGVTPNGSLVQDSSGNIYGTTQSGGRFGEVYFLSPEGTQFILHGFAGAGDGASPLAGVILGTDSNLYGTTYQGGASDHGTVFQVVPFGAETVLHSFAGPPTDGADPRSPVVEGPDGNFYGMTREGGANNLGMIYKVTPAGVETNLHDFAGPPTDGQYPASGLLVGRDGNFYGTTPSGGANNDGTVFVMTPAGAESIVYSFAGAPDGQGPLGGIMQASDGKLYGTTNNGGTSENCIFGCGTVYRLSIALPSAPTALAAAAGNAEVTLNWTAAAGTESYAVYSGTAAGAESSTPVQTGVAGTSATITGLSNGTTYYFKVAALNVSGASAQSNEASAEPVAGIAATPAFTPAAGTYNGTQQVTITDSTPGASIFYTTDGSTPTASSTRYTSAISVSSSGTIKAIATATGYSDSPVASADYTITHHNNGGGGGGAASPAVLGLLSLAALARRRRKQNAGMRRVAACPPD